MTHADAIAIQSEQMVLGFEDSRAWDEARHRLATIAPLVGIVRTTEDVRAAARAAGCHLTTVYAWLRRYEAGGRLADLLPMRSDGGRGKSRLSGDGERLVSEAIDSHFAAGCPTSIRALCETIRERCLAANVPAPHPNTVRARVSAYVRTSSGVEVAKQRTTVRYSTLNRYFDRSQKSLSSDAR